jgi:putative hydrolase of the HAD superfamily
VIAAVLFDWGDTLTHSDWNEEIAIAGNRAGLAAVAQAGLPTAEAINDWYRARFEEVFRLDSLDEVDLAAIQRRCFRDLGADVDEGGLERYLEASYAYWSRHHKRIHPDAHRLLDGLRGRGLRLGIVSNTITPLRLVEAEIAAEGLAERVDVVVFSCGVGKRKPHPAIFERALGALEVEPRDALFVGDRLWQDVSGAAHVGMQTAQALWYYEDATPNGATADFRVREPLDLLGVVASA